MTSVAHVTYVAMVTAVENDDVEALKHLLETGADVNANLDDDIGTVLHVAARENSIRCTEAILSHSHCPNGETVRIEVDALATEHRQTPLMTAALHGHVDMMRLLVAAGADINRQTSSCSTALIVACHYGHVNCVHALLDLGADPVIVNPWGFNALYMATDTPELLDRLLSYGSVDVNLHCGERQETAIHLAAVIGSVEATQKLLRAGANINARTSFNENALWLAIWKGHTEVPCMLIRQNIELDVPSNGCQVYVKHYLPLEVALGLQNYAVVRMLLTAGCSVVSRHYTCACDSEDQSPPLADVPWVLLHSEAFDYIRNDPEELSWLLSFFRNPVTLREICRRCIRRRLRTPLAKTIRKLQDIPAVLKDYIAMNDM